MNQKLKEDIIKFIEDCEDDLYYGSIEIKFSVTKGDIVNVKKIKEENNKITANPETRTYKK